MAIQPPSRAEAVRRINAINAALKSGYPRTGTQRKIGAVNAAAVALGISRQTLHSSIAIIKRTHNLEPDWSLEKVAPTASIPEVIEDRRQKDQISGLRKQVVSLQRELASMQDLRRALFNLTSDPVSPPNWTIKETKAGAPGIPMLFGSDFQWGETVRANELDGINAFNVKIAQARYRLLIEKTIDLSFNHMVNPQYPGIIYMRGGDMVSGDIHQELRETNELSANPAVKSLVEEETAGITRLADKFGAVWVISVPGNHGRTTMKPQAKRAVESNYDTVSAWWLESIFRGDKRVQFMTPESGDALFSVYGWRYLLTHGDKIGSRGGEGFIGPAATIARGMKKLVDYYAGLGQTVDRIFIGHFHEAMELRWGFCNGSLPGYSEYAKMNRMSPDVPKQWLFFSHPSHGLTVRWPIMLEAKLRRTVPVDDLASFKRRAA